MIEIVREPNGPVTIRITDENIEDIKEILATLFTESAFAQTRLQALSQRFGELEASVGELIGINRQLTEALAHREAEKKTHLPARGTKYYERLWSLCSEYLDGTFTSDDVPAKEKHILSILKNEYDVLEVAEKKGRRNFYRIKSGIARELLKDRGHWFSTSIKPDGRKEADSLVLEERGKQNFLLDVRETESGVIYEFYFPDSKHGEAFEERFLALPAE